MSKLGRDISIFLQSADEWECNEYHLIHMPTGIRLWISNGSFFLDLSDHRGSIGLIERHWLWFTQVRPLIKQKRLNQVLSIIEKYKLNS